MGCQQVKVHSTHTYIQKKLKAEEDPWSLHPGFNDGKPKQVPGDYTIYATRRPSWWNPGENNWSNSVIVVDDAPFVCDKKTPTAASRFWDQRAEYLAKVVIELPGLQPFLKCARIASEAAFSL